MTTQVAFLFPGQGSQAIGMGADVFDASTAARAVFEAVDAALGISLSTLCFNGPDEILRETINAQPAIVTVSLALLAAFQEALSPQNSSWSFPLVPSFTAGHSVGEYAALVAAGALDLRSAALLVRERGRLMHHEGTVCPGGMAAIIGMDAEPLQDICQEATETALAELAGDEANNRTHHPGQGHVIVANFNAPGQIVISGEQQALHKAMTLAKERGAKRVIPLAVSGAFHSPVMQPAASGLAEMIATMPIHDASIPVIGNIHALPLSGVEAIRTELAQQIASSVQWTRTIEYLANTGVTVFIEIGPGQALTGMVKRIIKGVTAVSLSNMADIAKTTALVRE
ncbi:MAG TPA: ACP S-malonyltransferase, partial [Ktedonobacteraceae bacterium]|nr:ACP S-malonyltransferase [Ktedonobacteraceae bacterium]